MTARKISTTNTLLCDKKWIKEFACINVSNDIIYAKQEDANVCLLECDPP